jgi:hypothetical protein
MATTSYGVTTADVTSKLPVDASAIPATGGRLSQADLTGFIQEASALVTGWVERAGRDPATLSDDARITLTVAIEAYAGMQALLKLGHGESGSKYQGFKRRFDAEERKWALSPQLVAGSPTTVESNVSPDATPSDYTRGRFTHW